MKWIAEHTAPTDTIASDLHLQAYLYAGRVGLPLSSLTVAEYAVPKPESVFWEEYTAIDSTYHPQWWIATSMTTALTVVEPRSKPMRNWRSVMGASRGGGGRVTRVSLTRVSV